MFCQLSFNKQVSCIIDPFAGMEKLALSGELDQAVELGVVIRERYLQMADAWSVIAGHPAANDNTCMAAPNGSRLPGGGHAGTPTMQCR